MWLFVFVFFIVGLISVISPTTSWLLSNWWRFNGDADPSELSLVIHRIGGVIMLIVAVSLGTRLL
ncbi:hypothetical protein AMS62_12630 [Bacillus sp. FJAT-18019]|nr:hypothetical protein AMS62_12630 [Bacillus sp. FJAT-18019]